MASGSIPVEELVHTSRPEQVIEDYCKDEVYYRLVCQKNLGVDSNPQPRARLARPACRRASAHSQRRINEHTNLVVSVVALERGVVQIKCTGIV